MALSLESANKVRQKTYGLGLDPLVYGQLKAFFQYWATHKDNADLQLCPIEAAVADDAGGQVLVTGAGTVYAIYGRKGTMDQRTAGTDTDSYLVILDDATDDSGGATDARISLPFLAASESVFYCSHSGIPFAAGVVAKTYTDFDGTTDSTTGDSPNGFVIVGG